MCTGRTAGIVTTGCSSLAHVDAWQRQGSEVIFLKKHWFFEKRLLTCDNICPIISIVDGTERQKLARPGIVGA